MINCKNIIKVVLLSLFICAFSGETFAQQSSQCDSGYHKDASGACLDACNKPAQREFCDQGMGNMGKEENKSTGNSPQNPTFCSGDLGIFTDLVTTGTTIFNRLRDLIYVVAGFGIIAVAVGGFFGNLNWKWLGAIVISLVVIATAGELIVLLTGCEQFGETLITNTLTAPTEKLDPYVNFDDSFAYAGEDGPFLESNTSDGVVD